MFADSAAMVSILRMGASVEGVSRACRKHDRCIGFRSASRSFCGHCNLGIEAKPSRLRYHTNTNTNTNTYVILY